MMKCIYCGEELKESVLSKMRESRTDCAGLQYLR